MENLRNALHEVLADHGDWVKEHKDEKEKLYKKIAHYAQCHMAEKQQATKLKLDAVSLISERYMGLYYRVHAILTVLDGRKDVR